MKYRSISLDDYDNLIKFWEEQYFVRGIDEYRYFKLFLEKNPNMSILAQDRGEIIGTVLGSFDGRRGYIQKLVVHKEYRKKGIGQELIKRIVQKLYKTGALYIPINCEKKLIPFYLKCGFRKTGQITVSLEK